MQKLKDILQSVNKRNRLSYNNVHGNKLIWQIFISPIHLIILLLVMLALSIIGGVLIVSLTPILDTIPGYPGAHSREILIKNIDKINSLERELTVWNKYRENIIKIMDGSPIVAIPTDFSESDSLKTSNSSDSINNDIDSLFRQSMAGVLSKSEKQSKSVFDLSSIEFFLPVKGIVTKNYNVRDGFRGIEFTVTKEEPVLAVNRGTVVFTTWSMEDGYIIQLQHGNGLTTTYKKLSHLIKNVGEIVEGGEVIGYVGENRDDIDKKQESVAEQKSDNNNENLSTNKSTLILEFWRNGNSIDPSKFLIM